ncbi:MAG: SpoIID/LytB domain-containing protein [Spirochaetota bacterium]
MFRISYHRAVLLLGAAAFSFLLACSPSGRYLSQQGKQIVSRESLYVRVLVLKSPEPVAVSSDGRVRVSNLKTRTIDYERSGAKIAFAPEKVMTPVIVESSSNWIEVNGVRYRGMAELHNIVGSVCVINLVRLDEYLSSVVPGEMSSTWHAEALKAQAVAARTYAWYHILKKKNDLYDLDATTNFQVYKGMSSESSAAFKAVADTAGQIMTFQNQPILSFFHSTCGGSTVDSRYVWSGEPISYLRDVKCEYCSRSPYYRWDEKLTMPEMKQYISRHYNGIGQIQGISFERYNGRVVNATVRHRNGMIKMSGNDFRMIFPVKKIKSMYFEAHKHGTDIELKGRGWGHGVGMCQYGAKGMAENGASYKNILQYYYRGVSLDRISR